MTTEKLVSAGCCFSPQERKEGRVQSPAVAGTNPNGFSMLTKTRLEIFETKSGAVVAIWVCPCPWCPDRIKTNCHFNAEEFIIFQIISRDRGVVAVIMNCKRILAWWWFPSYQISLAHHDAWPPLQLNILKLFISHHQLGTEGWVDPGIITNTRLEM